MKFYLGVTDQALRNILFRSSIVSLQAMKQIFDTVSFEEYKPSILN